MRLAIIGDTHFGVKGGNNDFLDFQFAWLEEALKRIQALRIKNILQTGDFYDVRAHIKMNVLHRTRKELPSLLRKYGIEKFYVYGGNHDMFYRDSNEICSLDILTDIDPDLFEVFTDEPYVLRMGSKRAILVPWLNKNNTESSMKKVLSSGADYVFGHFEMMGMPMIPGVICEHGTDPKTLSSFKHVISGHFHTISNHLNVTMVGTPYHLNWNDVQDGTNRGFWTLDPETDELVLHKNEEHMSMFSVIEYDPSEKYDESTFEPYKGTISKVLIADNSDPKHLKKFLALLPKAGFLDYKIIDTTEVEIEKVEIDEATLNLDTLSALNAFIDGQSDSMDKDRVKRLAGEIYMETLNGQ